MLLACSFFICKINARLPFKIILLQRVKNLGKLGDKVSVKAGYGRNFLIPQGKAVAATESNTAAFEARRAELEKA